MALFGRKCINCGRKEDLVEYVDMKVVSRIVEKDEVRDEDRKNKMLRLNDGKELRPSLYAHWGDYYCYWAVGSPTLINLCSTSCAIEYASTKSRLLMKKSQQISQDDTILPHQQLVNQYKEKTGRKNRGLYSEGKVFENPDNIFNIGQTIRFNNVSKLVQLKHGGIWWDFYERKDDKLRFLPCESNSSNYQEFAGKSMYMEYRHFEGLIKSSTDKSTALNILGSITASKIDLIKTNDLGGNFYTAKRELLLTWRNRYEPSVYPRKLATNLLYELLTTEKYGMNFCNILIR